ncbi:MAG TPA: helix-turn-helix transcriptional regulator [Terriglobia bacterium]|nr:helix-turn-helix transcriptional regulator [Terriglobia bacterium]
MASGQRFARQVGNAIRRLRVERRDTHRQLAGRAGIPVAALAAYEAGQQLPDLRTLRLLVVALGTTADDFGRHLGPWGCAAPEIRFTVS